MTGMMMAKQKKLSHIFLIVLILTFFAVDCADSGEASIGKVTSDQIREKPQIIWFHNAAEHTSNISLKTALSSGLISHVMIFCMHEKDMLEIPSHVEEAIELVKKSGAKLIWSRSAWPWYKVENTKVGEIFSAQYYIYLIASLKKEANDIGADYCALDFEPYANSILKPYLRSRDRIQLNKSQKFELQKALAETVKVIGKVDYVLPAASLDQNHPYNLFASLGDNLISEHTYYDDPEQIKKIKYPYQIFGAYLNHTKENKNSLTKPYFLANEIFEKSNLWSQKKGVLIYTSSKQSLQVAKDLVRYSKTLPVRDYADVIDLK